MHCPQCNKEVLCYGVSHGAASEEDLHQLRRRVEARGQLLLLNPPPCGPLLCPVCRVPLLPNPPPHPPDLP